MNDFLAFADGFMPGFSGQIQGSNPWIVAEYENLLGQQFPRFYRTFLETMGDSDGPLRVFEDAKISASELVHFYRRSVLTRECQFPTGTVPVAVNGWTFSEGCMSLADPEDGPVFTNRDTQIEFLYSDRLETLLYKKAFVALGMTLFPLSGMYLAQDVTLRLASVRQSLVDLRFQLEWYSDSVGVATRWDDGQLFARQYTGGRCWVRIAGHSHEAIDALARRICTPCELHFDRWWVPPQK